MISHSTHPDSFWMARAIQTAEKARLHAPPNPWVGCVIVASNQIIGEGHTQPPGKEHAEVLALSQAGSLAKGATVYVTLEPCSHTGKTAPCVHALIQAEVGRVVIGIQDPDSRVSGRGIDLLKQASIPVTMGVLEKEIQEQLCSYLHHRRTGMPYCILKTAMSIDGCIAAADGSSQWITGPEARKDSHSIRAHSQAILIGSGTALADNPKLTIRLPYLSSPPSPLRVVVDSLGTVPPQGHLADLSLAPTWIATTDQSSLEWRASWEQVGATVQVLPTLEKKVCLYSLLKLLGSQGTLQVMIEGGSRLHSTALNKNLVHRLIIYQGAKILGSGLPAFGGIFPKSVHEATAFHILRAAVLGPDVRIDYIKERENGSCKNN